MHDIVVGLGFGDEGKGSIVDWLTSDKAPRSEAATLVVRFNGGAQAAHNVVLDDGTHHTFSQFGSGTFNGVPTFLSEHVLVEPAALSSEAVHLSSLGIKNPLELIAIDSKALLTTPWHIKANRKIEVLRGANAHGTCGRGIGETVEYALHHETAPRVGDILKVDKLFKSLKLLKEYYLPIHIETPPIDDVIDLYQEFAKKVRISFDGQVLASALWSGRVVFEGAQGILLDETIGFHPHTTWSKTTAENALALLRKYSVSPFDAARIIGVTRSYTTRHGAGPMPTYDVGKSLNDTYKESHNSSQGKQGQFRVGVLDLPLLRYATTFGTPTEIALTHMDKYDHRVCSSYRFGSGEVLGLGNSFPNLNLTESLFAPDLGHVVTELNLSQRIWEETGVPVKYISSGPKTKDKVAV